MLSHLPELLSDEFLNFQPFPGLSIAFILIFYAPLALVVLPFAIYTLLARNNPVAAARRLSLIWGIACVPAGLMIVMGYAFQPHGWNPLIQILLWTAAGLTLVWSPVALRHAAGRLFAK